MDSEPFDHLPYTMVTPEVSEQFEVLILPFMACYSLFYYDYNASSIPFDIDWLTVTTSSQSENLKLNLVIKN